MDNEVKILFTSDIHLGLKNGDLNISDEIRINTFNKIIDLAREHDILIIAGDMVDDINNKLICNIINEKFTELKEKNTEIIYTPGINDLDNGNNIHTIIQNLNTSFIFSNINENKPYEYSKKNQKIYIYGIPAANNFDISKIKKKSKDGFHIGLFHVDYNFNKEKIPSLIYCLQKSDLKILSLDFYALGYNHNFKMFKTSNKIIGVNPGTPEPTTFKETGDRYVVSFLVKNDSIKDIKRLSINSITVTNVEFDCSLSSSSDTIIESIKKNGNKNQIQKLLLKGERNFNLDLEDLKNSSDFYYNLKIIDSTYPSIDLLVSENNSADSIKNDFFKILKKKFDEGNVPEGIDQNDLLMLLNVISKNDTDSLEDLLCDSTKA